MKLKTRLSIAFLTLILIPIVLTVTMVCLLGRYQISAIEKTYEISGTTVKSFSNSVLVMSRLTEKPYHELAKMAKKNPRKMEDATCLEEFNQKLEEKKAYLLVRKEGTIIYVGTDMDEANHVIGQLPDYGESENTSENGIYLGGEAQALIKQVDFHYSDGQEGSAFIGHGCEQHDSGSGGILCGYGIWNHHCADSYGGFADILDLPGDHAAAGEDAGSG